jgi:hypothetical protein
MSVSVLWLFPKYVRLVRFSDHQELLAFPEVTPCKRFIDKNSSLRLSIYRYGKSAVFLFVYENEHDRERGSWCYGMGQQIVHHYFNKQNHIFLYFP